MTQIPTPPQGPPRSPLLLPAPKAGATQPSEAASEAPAQGEAPALHDEEPESTSTPRDLQETVQLSELRTPAGTPTGSADVQVQMNLTPHQRAHATHALTGVHLAVEGAEMAHVLAGALVGGVVGNGLVGVGMTALGIDQIAQGVHEKSALEVVEGVGTTLLGARSGLAALAAGGESLGWHHATSLVEGAHGLLEPLGIAHGAIEVGVGGYTLSKGIREGDRDTIVEGIMGIGLGSSVVAASMGGGLPAVVAAAAFLTGKTIYSQHDQIVHYFHESKHLDEMTKWLGDDGKPTGDATKILEDAGISTGRPQEPGVSDKKAPSSEQKPPEG